MQKAIFAINGSASHPSSNLRILQFIADALGAAYEVTIMDDLTELPHFQTALTDENTPEAVVRFRNKIAAADGIIICTPEYVFSIPSGLKNAIEWCVSTTVFSDKPIGLITASASGVKGQEELKLIMKTVQTVFTEDTSLLIQGVKGKIDEEGKITDQKTKNELTQFLVSFQRLLAAYPE